MSDAPEIPASGQDAPKPKKSKKKLAIVGGIVAACLIAAGVGFFIWHEQPSFCNAICHSPMDHYVEGYYSDDPTNLASVHAQAGTTCLQCHEPTLDQQISEGLAWVSGDFDDPLKQRDFGTNEFCLQCHDREEILANTADLSRNPHEEGVHNANACGDCHSVHGTSTYTCASCHMVTVPDGWEAD